MDNPICKFFIPLLKGSEQVSSKTAEISAAGTNSEAKAEGALSFDHLNLHSSSFHWALWKAHSINIYIFVGTTSFWEIPPPLYLETLFTEAPQLSCAESIDLRVRRQGHHSPESWLVLYKSSIIIIFLPLLH